MTKAIHKYTFKFFSLILIFLFACSHNRSENATAIQTLNEGLENSNIKIDSEANSLYRLMEAKLLDPKFSQQANLWHPDADKIQLFSNEMYNYIDSLKDDLKKQPDFFKSKERGNELYDRLKNYKLNLLRLNPEFTSVFRNRILLTNKSFDSQEDKTKDFNKTFLNNTSTATTSAVLTKFQNNIRITESEMVAFCNDKIDNTPSEYNNFTLFVSQSGYDVSPGQKIQLLVGVGIFSKASQPKIKIDGKNASIGESGVVDYTFKASTDTGIHFIPIKVDYVNLKGITESKADTVEYDVGK